ncbi:TPA: DUF16 domain-containing protein [Candidatus Poribacteria bacterium]|nr:DUF16 domain-containing protein [Candidatus Poribacteria bacterium]
MAFTVKDYHDFVQLLSEHPEWKSELRHLLLSDELLALPQIVRELVEVQRHTEDRLNELVETQKHFEERLSRLETIVQHLTEQVHALTEEVRSLGEQVHILTEGQQRLTEQISALTEGQQRLTDTVGGMEGRLLEMTYREKAYGYFGHLLRRVKVVDLATIDDTLEAALAPSEFRDIFRLDLLLSGQLRQTPEPQQIWLAMEVSVTVDKSDVDRAWRRAGLLRQAGYCTLPVVAGERATLGAEVAARDGNVVMLQDGQVKFWEEALSAWGNTAIH